MSNGDFEWICKRCNKVNKILKDRFSSACINGRNHYIICSSCGLVLDHPLYSAENKDYLHEFQGKLNIFSGSLQRNRYEYEGKKNNYLARCPVYSSIRCFLDENFRYELTPIKLNGTDMKERYWKDSKGKIYSKSEAIKTLGIDPDINWDYIKLERQKRKK